MNSLSFNSRSTEARSRLTLKLWPFSWLTALWILTQKSVTLLSETKMWILIKSKIWNWKIIIYSETTEIFNGFTPGTCVNAVRARWDLQVHRFGNLLSECLLNSVHELNGWNRFISNLQESAQVSTNLLQNSGERNVWNTFIHLIHKLLRPIGFKRLHWLHVKAKTWPTHQWSFEINFTDCPALHANFRGVSRICCW